MFYRRAWAVTTIVLISATSGWAALIDLTVGGGESMVIRFHQPGVPPAGTDALLFNTGFQPPVSLDGTRFSLYDNEVLLGTVENLGTAPAGAFTSPASAWGSHSVDINFASILAGTLNGRIVVTPLSGAARYIAPDIVTVHANGDASFESGSLRTMIIDAAYVVPTASVPEPATVWLLVCGIVALRGARANKRHAMAS